MIRSLYSGVAGLKTQQTKMDVIGNNIANVGTYGFKSDRATFKDVYYQTTQTATASTGNSGGTNAKQIGYGNSVGSIDTNTKTSAMSSTGYGLDIAIAGEGFLQVMGPDGNIMYTKAGMLDIDADGNLVDVNGNFVLGVSGSDTSLPPASNKIKIDLPYLDADVSSVEDTINGVDFKITSSNQTDKANVNFTFVSSSSLPIGQKMVAKISGQSITVTVNAKENFASVADINKELNDAIKSANGGVEHPAGMFNLTMVPSDSKFTALDIDGVTSGRVSLKGSDLVSSDFGYYPGEIKMADDLNRLFSIESVGEKFTGDTRATKFEENFMAKITSANDNGYINIKNLDDSNVDISGSTEKEGVFDVTFSDGENDVTGELSKSQLLTLAIARNSKVSDISAVEYSDGKLTITCVVPAADDSTDTEDIEIENFSVDRLADMCRISDGLNVSLETSNGKSGKVSLNENQLKELASENNIDMSNIKSITTARYADGVITLESDDADPIEIQVTDEKLAKMAGIDLHDSNIPQDFKIKYSEDGGMDITMSVRDDVTGKKEYTAHVDPDQMQTAGSVKMMLSTPTLEPADYFVISFPSKTTLAASIGDIVNMNKDTAKLYNASGDLDSAIGEKEYTFTFSNAVSMKQSEPSRALGLGQSSFKLTGGTEGGEQTVANLTSISINSEGCIVGTHEKYGVVELGRIDLATFSNPAGLQKVGSTYFETSLNCGDPIIVNAGTEGTGQIMASTLEASNVDLSNEFSDMIMTQRGFQASSRVITVSDTMLEELINLKR